VNHNSRSRKKDKQADADGKDSEYSVEIFPNADGDGAPNAEKVEVKETKDEMHVREKKSDEFQEGLGTRSNVGFSYQVTMDQSKWTSWLYQNFVTHTVNPDQIKIPETVWMDVDVRGDKFTYSDITQRNPNTTRYIYHMYHDRIFMPWGIFLSTFLISFLVVLVPLVHMFGDWWILPLMAYLIFVAALFFWSQNRSNKIVVPFSGELLDFHSRSLMNEETWVVPLELCFQVYELLGSDIGQSSEIVYARIARAVQTHAGVNVHRFNFHFERENAIRYLFHFYNWRRWKGKYQDFVMTQVGSDLYSTDIGMKIWRSQYLQRFAPNFLSIKSAGSAIYKEMLLLLPWVCTSFLDHYLTPIFTIGRTLSWVLCIAWHESLLASSIPWPYLILFGVFFVVIFIRSMRKQIVDTRAGLNRPSIQTAVGWYWGRSTRPLWTTQVLYILNIIISSAASSKMSIISLTSSLVLLMHGPIFLKFTLDPSLRLWNIVSMIYLGLSNTYLSATDLSLSCSAFGVLAESTWPRITRLLNHCLQIN
jgi:hypothetical protein